MIGGWTLSDNAILTYGVNQGVFIPLEDYFEKYCPNISAILDLPGVREKKNDSTGRTHLHNSVRMYRYNRWIQPIHQYEWLENVGMSMPTTTDEFEAVLKPSKSRMQRQR